MEVEIKNYLRFETFARNGNLRKHECFTTENALTVGWKSCIKWFLKCLIPILPLFTFSTNFQASETMQLEFDFVFFSTRLFVISTAAGCAQRDESKRTSSSKKKCWNLKLFLYAFLWPVTNIKSMEEFSF